MNAANLTPGLIAALVALGAAGFAPARLMPAGR